MKIKNSFFNALLAAALIGGSVSAQEEAQDTSSSMFPEFMENMYAGVGAGLVLSFTDVKQYPSGLPVFKYRSELGGGVHGLLGYKFNSLWALEGSLGWMSVNGTDRAMPAWFNASVWQWDLNARFNIANAISKSTVESRKVDVYLLGGFGISAFRSVARVLSQGDADIDPVFSQYGYTSTTLGAKMRRTMELSIMGGVGVSYRVNSNIDLFLDLKGYYLNSDKLDATIGAGGSNDKYTYSSVGAIYHFGGTEKSRKLDEDDPINQMAEILSKFEDDDADGVPNYQDKDLNTPAGVKVYPDGTAIDTDGDGVADYKDQEKISPCKEVDANGVAKDSDKDGIADCNDVEPNTKAGAQVDGKGKAIETPSVAPAGLPTGGGEESASKGGVMSGLAPVFFASNSSSISYKNYESLTLVAQFLKANPSAKLVIAGNSDKVGSEEYNSVLAEKRAKAVVDYLVKNNGIDASRLTVVSNGSKNTISTKRNSQQDRRVDFLLSK